MSARVIPTGIHGLLDYLPGAANRVPRRREHPDGLDVTRKASGYLALGLWIHGCVARWVASIEGEAVLGALYCSVGRIGPAGEPRGHLNNSVRGFGNLPVTLYAP